MTDRINPSDRAILRAIAGANATEVTAEQARTAADGLAGRPRDGKVDHVEAEAVIGASRWSLASSETTQGLRDMLAGRRERLDIQAGPQSPTRFPTYLDVESLAIARISEDVIVFADKHGNTMDLRHAEDAPRFLSAAFARAKEPASTASRLALNASEAEAVALQLSRAILRKAHRLVPEFPDDIHVRSATAKTTPRAANEQDFSNYRHWSQGQKIPGGDQFVIDLQDDKQACFIITKDDMTIAFRNDRKGAWGAPRRLTPREVATLQVSREKVEVEQGFYKGVRLEEDILRRIWRGAMNGPATD